MATYIVGDIQGCFASLQALLEEVSFGSTDTLWCVGDLVNRGPDSLATLRFLRGLGERFACVLGNHDLHFLALVYGGHRPRPATRYRPFWRRRTAWILPSGCAANRCWRKQRRR